MSEYKCPRCESLDLKIFDSIGHIVKLCMLCFHSWTEIETEDGNYKIISED